jgi:hypothetical protein
LVPVRVVSMFTRQVCEFETAGVNPWAGKDSVTVSPTNVNIRFPGPRSTPSDGVRPVRLVKTDSGKPMYGWYMV